MGKPINLACELFYSGVWNHARSYVRQVVSAAWGIRDEGSGLTPARCTLQLDNRTLSYSPEDARNPLYGLVGRNTPGRVTLTPGLPEGALAEQADTFTRSSSSSWGTNDSGFAWSQFGFGGTVNASDFNVSGGFGTHSVPVVSAVRLTYLADVAVTDFDLATTFKVAQATGDSLEPAVLFRATSTTSYLMVRVSLNTSNQVILRVYSGETILDTVTTAITHLGNGTPLRIRVKAAGSQIHARIWVAANTEPATWDITVTDPDVPIPGFVGLRSGIAASNSNTKPVVFSWDNFELTPEITLADGAVSSWEPDREPGNVSNAWSDIAITGPSQRVNSAKAVRSALRGTMDAYIARGLGPKAYWPMEGYAQQPAVVASAVSTQPDASHTTQSATVASLLDWQGDDTLPGSQNLPVLSGNRTLVAGILGAPISVTPDPSLGFAFWTRSPAPSTGDAHGINTQAIQNFTRVGGAGVGYSMVLITYPPGSTLAAVPASGEVQIRVNLTLSGVIDQTVLITGLTYVDAWRMAYARLDQDGADTDVTIMIDGSTVGTGTFTAHTVGEVVRMTMSAFQQDTTGDATGTIAIGHPMVMADESGGLDSLAGVVYDAAFGYVGETTVERFERLTDERNIPSAVYGTTTQTMGAQRPAALPDLLAEIARTETGMMYDGRGWNGLEFRTSETIRNREPALALTFGEGGNVHIPIRPVTDDLGITNDVTANAPDGASYRVEKSSGPNNVNEPIDDPEGIGRVESTIDVNPESQLDLVDIAAWELHAGTWPGARYKSVTVDLSKHPELLPAAMAVRPGDLITIDELDADQVQLLVLGGVDSDGTGYDHRVKFNCVPAGPYRIGQVETTGFMRIGSSSSTLAADFDAGTDTSMSVAIAAGGALWSTTEPPFHIKVGGVVLNVTAVAGASSPQTFTVDATPVNGVERTLRTTDPDALKRINVEFPIYVGR